MKKQGHRQRKKELEAKANKRRFPELHTINIRRDGIGLLLLFIGVFTLYAVSTPRTIALEDDGLFVSAAWFAGVVHPPGYPLYTMLGWLSSHLLPFGEIPWRVHLVSGFMGAITCVCIAYLVLRRTGNRSAAYLAGAALAVSEHFWSQAIIADVYTTNTALLFLALVMVQEAVAKRDTRLWIVAAFLYGLGLANHWPLLILGSPIFIAYILTSGKEFWGKLHYLILSALIPAVLLYGWLVWRSHQDIPINFLGSIDSLGEMISFIRRDNFSSADSSASAGFMDKVYYTRYFITEWFLQLSLLGGILALYGVFRSYRGWRYGSYGEVVTVFTSSFLLIGLLGFDYEYWKIAIFRPYLLVAYCILALWFGLGINALMQMTSKWHKLSSPIICVSFSLVILALGIWNGRINYRANDRFAEQYAQSLFDVVEQKNAILVASGDGYIFPATYYHLVENKRTDIRLLDSKGLVLNDRVVQSLWSRKQKTAAWIEFVKNVNRPFYYQYLGTSLSEHTGLSFAAFVTKVDSSISPRQIRLETNDSAKQFFKKMIALTQTRDRWTIHQRNFSIETYGEYLEFAIGSNHSMVKNHIKDVLPLAENNYWSLMGMISSLLQQNSKYLSTAEKYLKEAKLLGDNQRSKANIARESYLEGVIAKKKGNSRKARNLFRKSIKISSKKTNPAYKTLKEL